MVLTTSFLLLHLESLLVSIVCCPLYGVSTRIVGVLSYLRCTHSSKYSTAPTCISLDGELPSLVSSPLQ